ncbi:hypothetical protein QYM36_019021 [Artemia franciscana]|uniref:Reverse transcriptase RNase H-like domain-containing protein n=1 Tax=Artemia franciscana TaxID=6661 RepID=A0AA88H1N8_ARTSF|nr:hypothetical protein QYM36_019021 [Artemia franciscana]
MEEHDERLKALLELALQKSTDVELKVDTLGHSLGAHLCFDGEVVAYAPWALKKIEQKYSQLKQKLYAVVYGCKYFHHYLYGRRVTVRTYHQPLETIVSKPVHKAPPQVQTNAAASAL